MRKAIFILVTVALLCTAVNVGVVRAEEGQDDQAVLRQLLNSLDISIAALRKGDTSGSQGSLSNASTLYESSFSPRVENIDNALDNRITQAFSSLQQTPVEENIFALRADVSSAAGLIGVSLPFIYAHAIFVVLGIGVIVSLLITLLNKRLVNWERIKQIKARISEFQKEFRDAQSKRDMKRVHKLQQQQKEILSLQGKIMSETMLRPMLFYIVPMILVWYLMLSVYGGWVIAWLPFRLDLPFFGSWVACGLISWYMITYFGFSSIFRKLLIGE